MAYKVFISHSTRDQRLVIRLANILSKFGVSVSVAEWYLTPGQKLDRKVRRKIENSDCIVVLLTQNGIRSNWVQQEIGIAKGAKKIIIPLVEKGVNRNYLGTLMMDDYIEYDPYQPQEALIKASTCVRQLKKLKGRKKEEQEKTSLLVGGILAFLLLLSGGEK